MRVIRATLATAALLGTLLGCINLACADAQMPIAGLCHQAGYMTLPVAGLCIQGTGASQAAPTPAPTQSPAAQNPPKPVAVAP